MTAKKVVPNKRCNVKYTKCLIKTGSNSHTCTENSLKIVFFEFNDLLLFENSKYSWGYTSYFPEFFLF